MRARTEIRVFPTQVALLGLGPVVGSNRLLVTPFVAVYHTFLLSAKCSELHKSFNDDPAMSNFGFSVVEFIEDG